MSEPVVDENAGLLRRPIAQVRGASVTGSSSLLADSEKVLQREVMPFTVVVDVSQLTATFKRHASQLVQHLIAD